jgi:YggT family protein
VASSAHLGVLADAISAIENFVHVFIFVYILLILVHIILSWVQLPYRTWIYRIRQFLSDVCNPYLNLFRRFLPSLGPIDVSPIVAVVVLVLVDRIVVSVLDRLH